MNLEQFLKQQKDKNRPTPEALASAHAFAERAADAQGFAPRAREFNEAAYLASLKSTEAARESAKRYCAFRNRN
jgi:capsule polysaccharide export protein KpsE/RkpR